MNAYMTLAVCDGFAILAGCDEQAASRFWRLAVVGRLSC
jgi:hypothetical protein